jgi:CRISPR type IV-associated protein Csf3
MEPLHITAYMQTPVVSDASLPLDAVLYYTAMREQYGDQVVTVPGSEHPNRVPAISLPLMRHHEEGPMWFYACSWAQWSRPVATGRDHWNKRFDLSLASLVDFQGRRGKVDVSSATYKAYHMPVFYRHSLSVCWYLVGHRQSIERWLPHCTHLGKKTAQGWGAVLRWRVETWQADWSVQDDAGHLMRAIPAESGILIGFRPSYWLPKNQTICEVPDAR